MLITDIRRRMKNSERARWLLPVSELGKNGVPKDSDFEPAHLLAKENGSLPQNAAEGAAPGTPFFD